MAILSIACPCALGLATPLGIINGITRATKQGILVKNTNGLLALQHIKTIVFDKTGTITTGKPTLLLTSSEINDTIRDALGLLASLEHGSNHPLAHAIVNKAKELNIPLHPVEDFTTLPGQGVSGTINGKKLYAGNLSYAKQILNTFDSSAIERLTTQ